MRALSAVLNDVIALGEMVVAKPLAMVSPARADSHTALSEEMQRHDSAPAEFVRSTRGGIALLSAVEEHWCALGARDERAAAMWLMLAGATLPIVRHELGITIKNEREALRS